MKKRRDITLGEMQDECKARNDNCDRGGDKCRFFEMCANMQTIDKGCLTPIMWNLSDPPRFNEAQLALLKVFYDRGFRRVMTGSTRDALVDCIREFLGIGEDVTLDLAELLGKDGAEC